MNRVELLHALTECELRQHRALVSRIQEVFAQLCAAHASYVVGSPKLIEPHVNVSWSLSTGLPHRKILLGGLNYTLALPERRHHIGIQHWEGDTFWLHASFQPLNTEARFTRFSHTIEGRDLTRVLSQCLDILVKESKPVRVLTERAKPNRPQNSM